MADERVQVPLEIVEETDEQYQLTGIEAELPSENSSVIKPYDPEQIRVDTKAFSLRQILDMIDDGDLELAPDFQRLKVWSTTQKSRLIESVLLRIPLPAFYFSSDSSGRLQVVDGLQRLSTIHDFVRGGLTKSAFFPLERLEYLEEQLGGKTFKDIQSGIWTRRINTTQISVNVIDPQTPHSVKFDIFKRINTGGSPLTAQEIRHCLSKPQSRDLLKSLTELDEFRQATTRALANNLRMADREVVLRFCAFLKYPGLKDYSRYASMDDFLNKASEKLDSITPSESDSIVANFSRAMENALTIFGLHTFRKWQVDENRLSPFNRALFEVWSVILSRYDNIIIAKHANTIRDKARKAMSYNAKFIASISAGTSDINKVNERFHTVEKILSESIG